MPRPPSAVDVIRRRLEAKRKIDHDQDRRTPFKEKVRTFSKVRCFLN